MYKSSFAIGKHCVFLEHLSPSSKNASCIQILALCLLVLANIVSFHSRVYQSANRSLRTRLLNDFVFKFKNGVSQCVYTCKDYWSASFMEYYIYKYKSIRRKVLNITWKEKNGLTKNTFVFSYRLSDITRGTTVLNISVVL